MKKLFTLGAAMTVACLAMSGQVTKPGTVRVYDYSDSSIKSNLMNVDITLDNGVYTIENFLNTGLPLQFTLAELKENAWTNDALVWCGETAEYDEEYNCVYLVDPASWNEEEGYYEEYGVAVLDSYGDATDVVMYYPSMYYGDGFDRSYLYPALKDDGTERVNRIYNEMVCGAEDEDGNWIYITIALQMPVFEEATPEPPVDEETKNGTVRVYDYSNSSVKSNLMNVDITFDNGVYTIENFLNTGLPLQFTLAELKENAWTNDALVWCGETAEYDEEYNCVYLVDPASWNEEEGYYEEYGVAVLDTYGDATDVVMYYPSMYYGDGFDRSYLYPALKEDGTERINRIYNEMVCGAEDEDGNWIYITIVLQMPVFGTTSAVNTLQTEEGTPVYYNLQGVRVSNPEKGIFIKRQGTKSQKVAF